MTTDNKAIKINIPSDVKIIFEAFYSSGYEIYAVGGCVRDSILNRRINDWDLCTNAAPEQMIEVCNNKKFKHIPTGLKHGTITVVLNNNNYEITTYRLDGDYSDGRHPDKVSFTSSLEEDLARRDFTINALAYNDEVGLIDFFGGLKDIDSRLIRCVGDANKRFNEDHLRRLRAIRFAAQLGFDLDEKTYSELKRNSECLSLLSVERVREELSKILLSDNASYGIRELTELHMMDFIIPEILRCVAFDQHNIHHDKDVFEHILSVVDYIPQRLELRLAALLHDIAKPVCFSMDEMGHGHFLEHDDKGSAMTEDILKRLKFDNKTIDKVYTLVKYHMNRYDKIKTSSVKRFINRVGRENLDDLFELQIADIKSSAAPYRNYNNVQNLRERCAQILNEKQPLTIKDLNINGRDLIQLGYKPGKEMGEALNFLLEQVLEKPELNTKEQLQELLKTKNSSL